MSAQHKRRHAWLKRKEKIAISSPLSFIFNENILFPIYLFADNLASVS